MSVWKSEVTDEMVSSLSDQEISLLVEALNTAVEEICTNWGMK
jgi:diacylglycerol kinase